MKNNRLTNDDLCKLKMGCERIRNLASLKNASFDINEEKDKMIKNEIRSYMMWFEIVANSMEELLNGKEIDWLYFR